MTTTISAFNASTGFWWGCTKISPGCDACYAESDCRGTGRGEELYSKDWKLTGQEKKPFCIWGQNAPRMEPPRKSIWQRAQDYDRIAEGTGRRFRVIVNSMSDFFEKRDDLTPVRNRAWEIIRTTPNVDWCILTKRHENILRCLPDDYKEKPWPHVWLGVSIEDQERADLRLKHLIPIMKDLKPAIFRLAIEPLLEEIHIDQYLDSGIIKWAFGGAESDQEPKVARPCHTAWGESIVKQFQDRGIPIHWKQWGSWDRMDKFKAKSWTVVMPRSGPFNYDTAPQTGEINHIVSSKGNFAALMKAVKEPCALIHKDRASSVSHEIFGKQIWKSPKNYVDWKNYSAWNIKAKKWSRSEDYKP